MDFFIWILELLRFLHCTYLTCIRNHHPEGGNFFYPKDLSNKLHKKKTNIKPQTGHHFFYILILWYRYVARERETKKQVNNR